MAKARRRRKRRGELQKEAHGFHRAERSPTSFFGKGPCGDYGKLESVPKPCLPTHGGFCHQSSAAHSGPQIL